MNVSSNIPATQEAALNAKAWIDAAESRWRLQILARRTRVTKSGVKSIPTRIRRFVEGIPWAYVKPAMDYLLSKAPYRGAIANGADFGVAYRPTLTVWQRDAQQAALGSVGRMAGDATYTLVQDLVEADANDVYTVGSSSSCSETVESEYVWDAAEVGELPQGGVGVTYQVASVHRNEDGTFDYAIVKRTALTQHAGPFTVESGPTHRVVHELWDNVYVGPDGEYLDDAGKPLAGFPEVGTEFIENGVRSVKIASVSENPDCTLKIAVQIEDVFTAVVRELTALDQYKGLREIERSGEREKLPDAPDSHGGVITRHQSKLRPDGSYDNEVHVDTERPVTAALREVSVGRRGVKVTVKSENQPEPADTSDIGWGGSVRVEKTPGRLFNNTVTTFDRNVASKVSESCKSDQYQHVHSTTKGADSVATGHASWGGGHFRTVEANMDDDGAILRTDRDDFERTVLQANFGYRIGLTGAVVTRKDVATAERVPSESQVTFGTQDVGTRKEFEKTPGGLVTVTTSSVQRPAKDVPVAIQCDSTALAHTVRTSNVSSKVPSFNDTSVHTAPSGGKHSTTSYRMDEQGGCTKETVDVQEQDVVAEKQFERKVHGLVTTTVWNSTDTAAKQPSTVGSLQHQVLTEGNRFRLTVRETDISDASPDRAFCSKDAFLHQHDVVTISDELPSDHVQDAGGGEYRHREANIDSDGVIQIVERVSSEIEREESGKSGSGDVFHTVVQVKRKNTGSAAFDVEDAGTPNGESGAITTYERDMTQGVMWSGHQTTDTPHYQHWSDEIDTSLYKAKIWYFRNAKPDEYRGFRDEAEAYAETFNVGNTVSGWVGGKAPTSLRVNGGPVMNGYGLYDGNYSVEASWDPVTGGADNDRTNELNELAKWTYTIVSNSYNIGYTRNANDEVITSVHRTKSAKTVEECITSGFKTYLASNFEGKTLIEGTHVTVTPSTGIAHGVVVKEAKTTISLEDVRGYTNDITKDWSRDT